MINKKIGGVLIGIGGIISFNIYNRIITDLFYLNKSRETGESSDYFFIFNPNI